VLQRREAMNYGWRWNTDQRNSVLSQSIPFPAMSFDLLVLLIHMQPLSFRRQGKEPLVEVMESFGKNYLRK